MRTLVLTLGLLACQSPQTVTPRASGAGQSAPSQAAPALKSTAPAPRSATSAAGAPVAAKMPALPGPGWHRVTRVFPERLNHPVWDPKSRQVFAMGARRVFAWDGKAWQPTPHAVGAGRAQLVATPDGVWVAEMDERKLFVHPLGRRPSKPIQLLPEAMSGARIEGAWHADRKQILLHIIDQNGQDAETFVLQGTRLKRLVAKAPSLMGIGWDGTRIAGFDVHDRLYHLDKRQWRRDPERLPSPGLAFAPDGALWLTGKTLQRRTATGWQAHSTPPGMYGATLAFDVGRDQIIVRGISEAQAGRTWVSTASKPFAPIDMGPWWRPTSESFGLVSGPNGLQHVHGRMGTISRLTAKGWQVEVADGLKIDPEWGASFTYGRWADSVLRLDPDGTLWRSHPWRRVTKEHTHLALIGEGPRLIAHAVDTGVTYAFEKDQWRELSAARDRAEADALISTSKGIYLGGGYTLWRLVGDAWQRVYRSEAFSVQQMAFDTQTGAMLAIGMDEDGASALAVFEAGGWRALAPVPGGDLDNNTAFGVDSKLRRAVLMTEVGEVWMLDLDLHPYKGGLPVATPAR